MSALPKCIQDELDRIEKSKIQVMDLLASAIVVEEVCAMFEGKWENRGLLWDPKEKNIESKVLTSPGQINGAMCWVSCKRLDDVLPVLREIRRRGYKLEGHDDYASARRRAYNFSSGIKVVVFLPEPTKEGDSCQFVQVGVREEPIYEVRCGGKKVSDSVEGAE